MYTYTIHEAKTQLSKILQMVAKGEEVMILNRDKPIAKIVPAEPKKRHLGSLQGKIDISDDFDAPLKDFRRYIK